MIFIPLRKYGAMVLVSVFFFYLGCCLTLTFTRIDCSTETSFNNAYTQNEHKNNYTTANYIVLIVSSPNNKAKRDAIRATWASFDNNIFIANGELVYKWNYTVIKKTQKTLIKLYFAVGTLGLNEIKLETLNNEQKRSEDMLFLQNVEDSYKNLSLKMLHAMHWLSRNLKEMKYVIKCDDDSFVRVDLIVKDLSAFAPSMSAPQLSSFVSLKDGLNLYKGLYWGYFNGHAKVYLNGKWQEKDWFLCDNYLPYALGGGYVISRSIVDYIANNIDILSYYNAEDVSMGVWTASLNGINRVHDIRFDTEWISRGCEETMLVRHKQTPSDMLLMYKTLVHSHGKKLCKSEELKRKSYFYNWNVLPSMCCNKS